MDGIWIGNGSDDFCSKPDKLFDEMTKSAFEDFTMTYIDFDDPYWYYAEEFINKDWSDEGSEFGRCKTFVYPDDVKKGVWKLQLETKASTYEVMISTPGNFLSPEYHSIIFEPNYKIVVKVEREVVQVLNYEGQPCQPTLTRDDCIDGYFFKVSCNLYI